MDNIKVKKAGTGLRKINQDHSKSTIFSAFLSNYKKVTDVKSIIITYYFINVFFFE